MHSAPKRCNPDAGVLVMRGPGKLLLPQEEGRTRVDGVTWHEYLRSDFIHMAGMTIHIALESTIHIVAIRTLSNLFADRQSKTSRLESIQRFLR